MLWIMVLCACVLLIPLDRPQVLARIAAGIAGLVSLRLVAMAYAYFRGRPGLGDGDAKLFGAAGLILGIDGLPVCLLVAVVSALASLAVEARSGAVLTRDFILPFGSHLALGLWLTFTFSPIDWGLG
jgi:leader peptidase (prepilin peptidase)/N-methyltransferase